MRHETIVAIDELSWVDESPLAWQASATFASMPIFEIDEPTNRRAFAPTPAAPDVPAAVGGMIAAAYAALIGAFAVATAGSLDSAFFVAIAGFFVAVFFTVPRLFLAVEPRNGARPGFDRFLRDGMQTFTGHSSGGAALVQMLIVPVFLTLAVLAIGAAAAIIT